MVHRLRILLLEPNRYQALLIDRELSERFPTAVIARFTSGVEAKEELHRACYDVVIFDGDSLNCNPEELFFTARAANSAVVLIVLGSTATSDEVIAAASKWADELVNHEERQPDELADIIQKFESRWQEASEAAGLLEARTRRAIISLTVGTLAHEINNPLMAILGATELLLGENSRLSAGERQKIQIILESAQRIQSTLSELSNLRHPVVASTPVGPMINAQASSGRL
jgi:signal transduction histidine kinase